MQSKLLHQVVGQRTFALIFEIGDELLADLKGFAGKEKLSAAQFTAIGAFREMVLGYFDGEQKDYRRKSSWGAARGRLIDRRRSLGPRDGGPAIHINVVLGKPDSSALAGHLREGKVRPTLELVLAESPSHFRKQHDPESGLTPARHRAFTGQFPMMQRTAG